MYHITSLITTTMTTIKLFGHLETIGLNLYQFLARFEIMQSGIEAFSFYEVRCKPQDVLKREPQNNTIKLMKNIT